MSWRWENVREQLEDILLQDAALLWGVGSLYQILCIASPARQVYGLTESLCLVMYGLRVPNGNTFAGLWLSSKINAKATFFLKREHHALVSAGGSPQRDGAQGCALEMECGWC